MPGVSVTTSTRSGTSAPLPAPGSRYFVAGITSQGPLVPTLVRSITDYVAAFGPRVTFGALYDDLRVHFEEGGLEAVVCRTVGPAAVTATVTLSDRATTPVPTLQINAANPGVWGSGISVSVVASATTGAYDLNVIFGGVVVESYTALVTPGDAAVALSISGYVRGVSLGSASVAPTNQPAIAAATPLTGGADDRASVTVTQYAAALDLAGEVWGSGAVAVPGQPASVVGVALQAHCVKYSTRIALLAVAPGSTLTQAKAAVAAQRAAAPVGLEYVGLFWPSLTFTMPGSVPRTVTPEGFVAAQRAEAIAVAGGPWLNPAGARGIGTFVTGIDTAVDAASGLDANNNGVSAIRLIGNGGPRLYGWRSLSLDTANYFELKDRDVLNRLTELAKAAMETYAFATIDAGGQLLGRMRADLLGICQGVAQSGGLYPQIAADGSQIDPGYSVDVSPAINTQAVVLAGQVSAAMAVRLAPTAETVLLSIVKAAVGSSVLV